MSKSISKGHLTIVDLNDGRVMNLSIRSNIYQQIYCADNSLPYTPNFETYPLVILPILTMTGVENTNLLTSANASVEYKVLAQGSTTALDLESYFGKDGYAKAATTDGQKLTIKKNLTVDYIIILVTTSYVESGITYSAYNEVLITKLVLGVNTVNILPETPYGDSFYTNMPQIDGDTKICMVAHLMRGGVVDDSNIEWEWSKMGDDGNWSVLKTTDYADSTGNEYLTSTGAGSQHPSSTAHSSGCCTLWVKPDAIDNFELYKCTIYDLDTATGASDRSKFINTVFTISDRTDPYKVDITDDTPDKITLTQDTITVKLRMLLNDEEIENYFHKVGVGVTWSLYTNVTDSDNNTTYALNTDWGTKGFKTTSNTEATVASGNYCNVMTISKKEINKRANLVFEVFEGA